MPRTFRDKDRIMASSTNEAMGEGGSRKISPVGGAAGGGTGEKSEFIPEKGFSKDIFTGNLEDKYVCKICKQVLREPVQSACGHRFCKVCFEKLCRSMSKGEKVICPACKDEDDIDPDSSYMSLEMMYPDTAIKRELNKFNVKCMNPGCPWTGQFKSYIEHEKVCEFRGKACPNCNKNIPESRLKEHMENLCQKRKVKCKNCNAEILYSDVKEHSKTCPKEPMQCEACHKRVIRDKYTQHLEEDCIRRIIKCPAGCNDVLRYDQLSTHIQKNMSSHLKFVLESIDKINKKIEDKVNTLTSPGYIQELERAISGLTRRLDVLEHSGHGNESGASGGISACDDIGLTSRMAATELRLNAFEPIMGVLHREIEKCIGIIETIDKKQGEDSRGREDFWRKIDEFETKIRTLDRALQTKEVALSQYEMRFEMLEFTRHDGILTWRISNFKQKRHDAVTSKTTSLYSPTFYTATNAGHVGYKMCARLYPNGDGMGKSTHISLFFVLMRGNFDNLLPWPFREKVTLKMIDQNNKEHIEDTFKPDPTSSSFKKPETEMNIASGCPLFLPLKRLDDPNFAYVKDDVMFIKIIVDNSYSNKYLNNGVSNTTSI